MVTSARHVADIPDQRAITPLGNNAGRRMLKRLCDLTGSLVLIALLLPVLIVVAIAVVVFDGAPVIHRRRVVGPKSEFDAYKFRTMLPDADRTLASDLELQRVYSQSFKLKTDPRVTELGRVLRKYSVDELPQLFNVLRGQMSLVGPRMITAPELDKYGQYKKVLLTVKPGLTGYWQVHGRQEVSYEERVRMDVHYITHWTLKMDLKILLLTPLRVIRGKGAY
jgi:lipopolysaccharide/colanic/teichoic acid biosynthesis glycosyltransferase